MKVDRAARPIVIGHIEPGHDCYAPRQELIAAVENGSARRWVTFRSQLTTVEHGYQCWAKAPDGFSDHKDDPTKLRALVDEARSHGVVLPTGYADVFHKAFFTPRVKASANLLFSPAFAGGWQQALQVGELPGRWHLYDIRSAYLSAALMGLPDPATFSFTSEVCHRRPGLYRVRLEAPEPSAPYPYNVAVDVNASDYEIQLYGLAVREVLGGVTWTREVPVQPIEDAVRRVTFWKAAARSFWGRWAMSDKIENHWASGAESVLPPIGQNQIWAHLIVGRVRERVYHVTGDDTAHVFVDSVLTRTPLRTGPHIGDWDLKRTYDAGVYIHGPGMFGDLSSGIFDKACGIPRGAIERRKIRFDPLYGNVEVA